MVITSSVFHRNGGLAFPTSPFLVIHMENQFESPLRSARKAKKLSMRVLGELAGTTAQQIERLEKGQRKLTKEWAEKLAPHLDMEASDLLFQRETVPLVGYVSAGSSIAFLWDEGQLSYESVPAPKNVGTQTYAVEIRGDSLGPSFDGWLAYYDDYRDAVTPDLVGKLCIVGLTDGRVVIKTLRRGERPGRYDLFGNNDSRPIYDAEVKWAAPVITIAPRRM